MVALTFEAFQHIEDTVVAGIARNPRRMVRAHAATAQQQDRLIWLHDSLQIVHEALDALIGAVPFHMQRPRHAADVPDFGRRAHIDQPCTTFYIDATSGGVTAPA